MTFGSFILYKKYVVGGMDKLKDMETFLAVIEKGTFFGAASACGVTPVMVGRRIGQLENRLGGKLFDRAPRKLTLTAQGETYLEHCRRILGRLGTAERVVKNGLDYATGHLIVTAPAAFGRRHVAPHLPEFMTVNPDVTISLNLSDQIVDLVRNGYELGIRIGTVVEPNLVPIRLAPNRSVVCGTAAYFERFGIPQTPDDLARHNCLTFNGNGGQQRGWLFRWGDRHVAIKGGGNLSCNDGAVLSQWVREGLGLAWRPLWEVTDAIASGELMTILDDYALPHHDVVAVYPHQTNPPAKVSLFIAWLRDVYARPGYWAVSRQPASSLISPDSPRETMSVP
jgi:DNA-binding transcriptional LysR family regulator